MCDLHGGACFSGSFRRIELMRGTQPIDTPFLLPKCMHTGCRDCILGYFARCEEKGEEVRPSAPHSSFAHPLIHPMQARCPTCNVGPIDVEELLEVKRGRKPKKPAFTISTSSPSSSSQHEILTIIDSSDEEDAPPAAAKVSPLASKSKDNGKGKAKAAESDDEYEEDGDARMGDVNDSEEEKEPRTSPGVEEGGGIRLLKNDFKTSTKLEALKNSLEAAREKDPTLKAVVFSQVRSWSLFGACGDSDGPRWQFTGFLDLIERLMNRERFKCVALLLREEVADACSAATFVSMDLCRSVLASKSSTSSPRAASRVSSSLLSRSLALVSSVACGTSEAVADFAVVDRAELDCG